MTLKLEDILAFMKEEKLDRQKEREADMSEMKELILKGVQEKVEAAIKPIQERILEVEQDQVNIKEQFSNLLQELKEIKEQMRPSGGFPELARTQIPRLGNAGSTKFSSLEDTIQENLHKAVNPETREIRQIATEARKIIGLHNISKEDVERVSRISGAQDEQGAYLEAVKEFFKLEMRIGQDEFDRLGVKHVFPPAKEQWDTLYVVFESTPSQVHPQTIL